MRWYREIHLFMSLSGGFPLKFRFCYCPYYDCMLSWMPCPRLMKIGALGDGSMQIPNTTVNLLSEQALTMNIQGTYLSNLQVWGEGLLFHAVGARKRKRNNTLQANTDMARPEEGTGNAIEGLPPSELISEHMQSSAFIIKKPGTLNLRIIQTISVVKIKKVRKLWID